MTTRILTLFDDDFFEQEEPKKKAESKAKEPEARQPAEGNMEDEPALASKPSFVIEYPQPEPSASTEGEASVQQADAIGEQAVEEQSASEVDTAIIENSTGGAADEEPENGPRTVEAVNDNDNIDESGPLPDTALEQTEEKEPEPEQTTDEQLHQQNFEDNTGQEGDSELDEQTPAAPVSEEVKAADEELNKQILSELIQLDYTALIHRDYPFSVEKAEVVQKEVKAVPEVREPLIEKKNDTHFEEESFLAEQLAEMEEDTEEVFEEIVPLPEWNLNKNYYTIGEVAQLFKVNTSHIRFWTTEFKLRPRTTRKGDRLYNPKDIAELRLIHHLVKEKKHTIKGAREKLKAEKEGVNNKLDLKDSLVALRDMLQQIKEQI